MFSQFKWCFILSAVGIVLGGFAGAFISTAGMLGGFIVGLERTAVLGVAEASMSLDNSVVASGILKSMSPVWQQRYITWGFPIAVIVMRFSLPILLVSAITAQAPWTTFMMAIRHPAEYGAVLTSHEHQITAFGGSFLLLIALSYFMGDEKGEDHWIGFIESTMAKLGTMTTMPLVITLCVLVGTAIFAIPDMEFRSYMLSGVSGVIGYYLVKDGLSALMGTELTPKDMVGTGGFGTFCYLECIDASFSFDGVIGAFAITNNIFQIAIGLGIGALFIRKLTLITVESGAIDDLPYIENGAFMAILTLSAIMFFNLKIHVPDFVTGLVGAGFIGAALIASIRENRKNATT